MVKSIEDIVNEFAQRNPDIVITDKDKALAEEWRRQYADALNANDILYAVEPVKKKKNPLEPFLSFFNVDSDKERWIEEIKNINPNVSYQFPLDFAEKYEGFTAHELRELGYPIADTFTKEKLGKEGYFFSGFAQQQLKRVFEGNVK